MAVWDFRKSLFRFKPYHKEDFLEKPLFLESLTIGTAIVFILLWPYKLTHKRL